MDTGWGARLAAVHERRRALRAVETQLIADALADRADLVEIAAAVRLRNRVVAFDRILHLRTPLAPPPAVPVVVLRGVEGLERKAAEGALWSRGWRTEVDEASARHLALGGVPVVACDLAETEKRWDTGTVAVAVLDAETAASEADLLAHGVRVERPTCWDDEAESDDGHHGARVFDLDGLARLVGWLLAGGNPRDLF